MVQRLQGSSTRTYGLLAAEDKSSKARTRGRSRNDQVATDLRLWLRDELREIERLLINLLKTVAERAEEDIDNLMPGYTHLQRGQVSSVKTKLRSWLLTAF